MKLDKTMMINGGERGNALFLILIAVALFAALSYAITQSGRGGGSVSAQTALITAGQVTEEPADVRSAATRMILTGVTATAITYLGDSGCGGACADDVFDQAHGGGGATSVPPPGAACNTPSDCTAWVYVPAYATGKGYYVLGVGSTGVNGSDALAILEGASDTSAVDGIPLQVCQAIDKGLGFPTAAATAPPVLATKVVLNNTATGASSTTGANQATTYLGTGSCNAYTICDVSQTYLSNQDFACVEQPASTVGPYAYYGSLIDQ